MICPNKYGYILLYPIFRFPNQSPIYSCKISWDRLKMLALVDNTWMDEMCSAASVQRQKRDAEVVYYDQQLFLETVTENEDTIEQVCASGLYKFYTSKCTPVGVEKVNNVMFMPEIINYVIKFLRKFNHPPPKNINYSLLSARQLKLILWRYKEGC